MADRHGFAYYPKIPDCETASYDCRHGTTPGTVSMSIPYQDLSKVPTYGDLVISDGITTLPLRNCKLVGKSGSGTAGATFNLTFLDRRWAWANGTIEGYYNLRLPDGSIDDTTIESPQTLIEKCLDEMGEKDYVLKNIPTPKKFDDFPEAKWDQKNPAAALSELCDVLGLRVIFQPFKNRVLIDRTGDGVPMPEGESSYSASLTASPGVASVEVIGAPTVFQMAFVLRPIGREPDGRIVPLDDLSFKPKGGWGKSPPPYFPNLVIPTNRTEQAANLLVPGIRLQALDDTEYRELALASVWRMFRIELLNPATGGDDFAIPGYDAKNFPKIIDRSQIYLLPGLMKIQNGNFKKRDPDEPRVYGSWADGRIGTMGKTEDPNTAKKKRIEVPFTIDSDRGIVTFSEPVFRFSNPGFPIKATKTGLAIADGQIGAPDIVLVTSCYVRDYDTRAFVRYRKETPVAGVDPIKAAPKGTKPLPLVRLDLQVVTEAEFDTTTWVCAKSKNDQPEVDKHSEFYRLNFVNQLNRNQDGFNSSFPGLIKIDPDGAIWSVSWSVGGGAKTQIARNCEASVFEESWPVQRRREKTKVFFGGY